MKPFRELTVDEVENLHVYLQYNVDHRAQLGAEEAYELGIVPGLSSLQLGIVNGLIGQWSRIADPNDEKMFDLMVRKSIKALIGQEKHDDRKSQAK